MAACTNDTYLIVGAGCFGASTALALKRALPAADVTLVDRTPFPCPFAAAHDLNKIIRAEYEDPFYMDLAREAQHEWRTNPTFNPYYHETGVLRACSGSTGQHYIDNYETLLGKGNAPATLLAVDDAKTRFDGLFRDGDWTGVANCAYNPRAGWGDAAEALRAVVDAAVELGVRYVQATVTKLKFGPDDVCAGVVTDVGDSLEAGRVILCTGAHTAWLLAESAPARPEIHVGDRMVAAAAVMCLHQLPGDQISKFSSAPVIIQAVGDYPGMILCRSCFFFFIKKIQGRSRVLTCVQLSRVYSSRREGPRQMHPRTELQPPRLPRIIRDAHLGAAVADDPGHMDGPCPPGPEGRDRGREIKALWRVGPRLGTPCIPHVLVSGPPSPSTAPTQQPW